MGASGGAGQLQAVGEGAGAVHLYVAVIVRSSMPTWITRAASSAECTAHSCRLVNRSPLPLPLMSTFAREP